MNLEATEDEMKYLTRNTSRFCKCGLPKLIKKSTQSKIGKILYRTCGKKECEPSFGKKRPEHSRIMKEKVLNGSDAFKSTLMKPGIKFNPEVNTIEFKRKRLYKHGIIVPDSEIEVAYSKLLSSFKTNLKRKKVEIVMRYENWESEYKKLILVITNNIIPTKDWVDGLSDDEALKIWKRIHGVNTIRNWSKVKTTRSVFFKQELLSGFNFNSRGQTSVFTRSGLEKDWILFFEKNEIPWCYETNVIETVRKDGFHIPDFEIILNNESIILEVKGGFFNQDKEDYIFNKVYAAVEFAKRNEKTYVLTQQPPSLNLFEGAMIVERIKIA